MALDPKKITANTAEILNNAAEIVKEAANQQLSPLHLAIAQFEDTQGERNECDTRPETVHLPAAGHHAVRA